MAHENPRSRLIIRFRPMTYADAQAIVRWRYPEPYHLYNLDERDLPLLIDSNRRYYAALSQDDLIGLCCFGLEARVPGGRYTPGEPAALDVGLGLRPDLTGGGRGVWFAGHVLDYGDSLHAPDTFRATIAEFNRRSQRVFSALGFKTFHTFRREGGEMVFIEFSMDASAFRSSWRKHLS